MALQPVLRGVKIVEQGTFITGPCAGMMLADLGADVIKIESPGGDPYRAYQGGLYSPHFQAYNRNKRSIVCDLKQAADRELFERLVSEADVYIQNFRPGTAEKLGAGPARMRELNPRLVYCSISGFGGERPVRRASQLRLGGAGAVRLPERGGRRRPAAVPRAGAGRRHHRHLRGALACWARCSNAPAPAAASWSRCPCWKPWRISPSNPSRRIFALGVVPKSSDRPRLAQAYILRTADAKLIAIHLSSLEKFWLGLVKALDADELARDVRFNERLARIANYEALGEELDQPFPPPPADRSGAQRLNDNDVPFAPINGIDAVVEDPQVGHLGLIVPVNDAQQGGRAAVRPALQFDGERARSVSAAPLLDQHGAAIRDGGERQPALAGGHGRRGSAPGNGLVRESMSDSNRKFFPDHAGGQPAAAGVAHRSQEAGGTFSAARACARVVARR